MAATGLLVVAGAGHGGGFGALVQRTVGKVSAAHAATFSGVLSTVIQLAIAVGIAATATLYHADPRVGTLSGFSVTVLAQAIVQAVAGTVIAFALRRSAAETGRPSA